MDTAKGVQMTVNDFELNISIAAFDGCHKIYIPMKGQESEFIQSMEANGWIWEEDFYKIEKVTDLLDMYLSSCPLRFIQQVDCSGGEAMYIDIIPQGAFYTNDFFDEDLARKAFAA